MLIEFFQVHIFFLFRQSNELFVTASLTATVIGFGQGLLD